jgi:hypothetical protein
MAKSDVEEDYISAHEDTEDEDKEEDKDKSEVEAEVAVAEKSKPKRKSRTKKTYPPSDRMFDDLLSSMILLRDLTRKVITLTKETQKSLKSEVKGLNQTLKKERNEKPTRKPRGFALPSPISNEMVDYLNNVANITEVERKIPDLSSPDQPPTIVMVKLEYGCTLARNELTSALCNHFRNAEMRKNDLDKRDIHLDKKTVELFGIDPKQFEETGGRISEGGEPIITYFDLQKYLPRHCGKKD